MEEKLAERSPCSSESESPGILNRACLLGAAELIQHDLSPLTVPETPSPQLAKRRRRGHIAEEHFSPVAPRSPSARPERSACAYRGFALKTKRRRLVEEMQEQNDGFVPPPPPSLRVSPLDNWLEAPLPTPTTTPPPPPPLQHHHHHHHRPHHPHPPTSHSHQYQKRKWKRLR
ncbi:hypothetical protein LDENG_00184090 [Lucifuga dentata]|nr:hypothetical protein LDENG_00184090 [Lucifuga dentata]